MDPVTTSRDYNVALQESMMFAVGERKSDDEGAGLGVTTRTHARTKIPSPYKLLMLNDDYTPMEFVVLVLQRSSGSQ